MIHDKDYILRMVKQLSEALSLLLLGNNEGIPQDEELALDTHIRNVFKLTKEELSSKTISELHSIVESKPESHRLGYYEVLGHFYFLLFKSYAKKDHALKARTFYLLWLEQSKIFSLVVMARLEELTPKKTDLE